MRAAESRYSRQSRFAPLGEAGQERIRRSTVVLVGCGALGTVAAELMTRAGVGRLRIIDRDFVELSNLQRQFLFEESDAAEALPKAVAAARHLARVNSEVLLEPVVADLVPSNAEELFENADVILDGTDNFETRFLINDAAVSANRPWIYAAAVGSYGLKLAILPGITACLRCVYPEPPQGAQPTCETEGVLGPLTSTIASLAAADALKILACGPAAERSSPDRPPYGDATVTHGENTVTHGEFHGKNTVNWRTNARITTVDVWTGNIRQVGPPARDPACPCCVRREFVYLNGSKRAPISLCGRNAVQIHERSRPVNLDELAVRLRAIAQVRANEFALRASIDSYELTVFPDGRAIIKGTTDTGIARSLYARYVGA